VPILIFRDSTIRANSAGRPPNPDLSCLDKYPYTTFQAAKRAVWLLRRYKDRRCLEAYKCPVCRLWHVGRGARRILLGLGIPQVRP